MIKKHKEQLLKERYRFNMGLLMGIISHLFGSKSSLPLNPERQTGFLNVYMLQVKHVQLSSGRMEKRSKTKWICRYLFCMTLKEDDSVAVLLCC